MVEPTPSTDRILTNTITDLDEDSLAHCAEYLSLQDVTNIAITCKSLKQLAYSDSIWQRFFRERWPQEILSHSLHASGVREAYLTRRTALQKFKFLDPKVTDFYTEPKPFDHILLNKEDIIFSQGSTIQIVNLRRLWNWDASLVSLTDHNARITCMRLFPIVETSLFRSESLRQEKVLVSASSDHTIRLWWKGSSQRCFRGHNGAVSTLSDKLLSDDNGGVLASGGEDCTVRLWSLSSSVKRGRHASLATLHGHERPVKFMSVAGHKTSLLASISKDSKVRVWDTTASSSSRSSCCVGMTSVSGAPVDMKCHESLIYVATDSSVTTIDLRTMQKVSTLAIYQQKLKSFGIVPSKSLICTGGIDKAMLWDVRRNQDIVKPEPVAELEGHNGPVTHLYMDPYKIVTGGPKDPYVNVWETESGTKTNSLLTCWDPEDSMETESGCSAMAVNGFQVVTGSYYEENGFVRFTDFSNATSPMLKYEVEDGSSSKFWDAKKSYSDTD